MLQPAALHQPSPVTAVDCSQRHTSARLQLHHSCIRAPQLLPSQLQHSTTLREVVCNAAASGAALSHRPLRQPTAHHAMTQHDCSPISAAAVHTTITQSTVGLWRRSSFGLVVIEPSWSGPGHTAVYKTNVGSTRDYFFPQKLVSLPRDQSEDRAMWHGGREKLSGNDRRLAKRVRKGRPTVSA